MLSASAQQQYLKWSFTYWLSWLIFDLTHPGTVEIVTTPKATWLYCDRREKTRRLVETTTPTHDRREREQRAGQDIMRLQAQEAAERAQNTR